MMVVLMVITGGRTVTVHGSRLFPKQSELTNSPEFQNRGGLRGEDIATLDSPLADVLCAMEDEEDCFIYRSLARSFIILSISFLCLRKGGLYTASRNCHYGGARPCVSKLQAAREAIVSADVSSSSIVPRTAYRRQAGRQAVVRG